MSAFQNRWELQGKEKESTFNSTGLIWERGCIIRQLGGGLFTDVAEEIAAFMDSRLTYRGIGTTSSIVVASYLGGPYGEVLGVVFTGLEKTYDVTEPARKEIVNNYYQFKKNLNEFMAEI